MKKHFMERSEHKLYFEFILSEVETCEAESKDII